MQGKQFICGNTFGALTGVAHVSVCVFIVDVVAATAFNTHFDAFLCVAATFVTRATTSIVTTNFAQMRLLL